MTDNKRKSLAAIILAATFLLLASREGMALDKVRAAMAHGRLWDTGVTTRVAQEEGFFKKEGLEVDARFVRGGPEAVTMLVTGELDIVLTGIMSAVGTFGKGVPIRIIAAEATGNEVFWYVRADSKIKSVADLDGKTFGHNQPGTSTHLSALEIKAHTGAKFKLVMAGRMPDQLTQVLSGQIDAGYSVPPYSIQRVRSGELRIIARGNDYPSLRNSTQRVFIASKKFLAKDRDVARRFIKARWAAINWMYKNLDLMVPKYAKLNKVSVEVAREAVTFYSLDFLAPAPIKGVDDWIKRAIKFKFLKKQLSPAQRADMIDIVYDQSKS